MPENENTNVEAEEGDNLAELRAAADRSKAHKDEADRLKRELAFTKAGIDTESGVGALLFKTFDGDPTKDAVLAAAREYGITPGPAQQEETTPKVELSADELAQSRERAALATSSEPPGKEAAEDPRIAGLAEFHEARAAGATQADAAAAYYNKVVGAAMNGDQRVIYDAARWRAENADA